MMAGQCQSTPAGEHDPGRRHGRCRGRELLCLELSQLLLQPSDRFTLLSCDHGEVDQLRGEFADRFIAMLRREFAQFRFDHLGCACHESARYALSRTGASVSANI
jgi:hypothetical protein